MTTTTSLLLIGGSLRRGSTNEAVLRTLAAEPGSGWRAEVYEDLATLPLFNPDDDGDPPPAPVVALRQAIAAADALLICTPEYAGALPAAMKNLLEWTVGGGEMIEKPVGWINAASTAAPKGGADAHESLAKVLTYTSAAIVEPACIRVPIERRDVGADGLISDPELLTALRASPDALTAAVEALRSTASG